MRTVSSFLRGPRLGESLRARSHFDVLVRNVTRGESPKSRSRKIPPRFGGPPLGFRTFALPFSFVHHVTRSTPAFPRAHQTHYSFISFHAPHLTSVLRDRACRGPRKAQRRPTPPPPFPYAWPWPPSRRPPALSLLEYHQIMDFICSNEELRGYPGARGAGPRGSRTRPILFLLSSFPFTVSSSPWTSRPTAPPPPSPPSPPSPSVAAPSPLAMSRSRHHSSPFSFLLPPPLLSSFSSFLPLQLHPPPLLPSLFLLCLYLLSPLLHILLVLFLSILLSTLLGCSSSLPVDPLLRHLPLRHPHGPRRVGGLQVPLRPRPRDRRPRHRGTPRFLPLYLCPIPFPLHWNHSLPGRFLCDQAQGR